MLENIWSGLGASSTKFAFVIGIITILSQAQASAPFNTPNAIAQMIATIIAVGLSVYTVMCLNTGGCNKFAWFTMLLPVILFGLIIVTNLIGLPVSAYGSSPAWQEMFINQDGVPIKNRSTCDVHVQDDKAFKAVPINSGEEIDFYSKNQFHNYYDGPGIFKDNYWRK